MQQRRPALPVCPVPTGSRGTMGKLQSQTCFLCHSKVNGHVTYIVRVRALGNLDDGCFIHKNARLFLKLCVF